ncbi:kinase-like domain-containing protein [Schizophyllum amplum]|uniref:non-specific serine/threonine protein kinase n=1 Tax=Schizophyllum amplum TaxID=97359 RepID=A0A550C864_9AGAR|nr:kinase-like domain-containing protein [Auriculariopsis ampla]
MRVKIDDLISFGACGRVYTGRITSDPMERVVAVKKSLWAPSIKNSMLRHEACTILALKGHENIPQVFAYGRSQCFEYMALEILGADIDTPLGNPEGLTVSNLVALACQMIGALEHAHSHHIVHCDVKPFNFLFDHNPATGLIKLIDFGLAKVYRDPRTLEHVEPTTTSHADGTRAFISLNVHLHHNPLRRDDMESLAYTIAALLCDGLPWYDVSHSECFAVKQTWSGAALCAGYDPVFGEFVDYTRSLHFREAPDYEGWRRRFLALAPHLCGRPLYNPADRSTRVGERRGNGAPTASVVRPKPSSHTSARDKLIPDERRYCPRSTWARAASVGDENVVGDEGKMVREHLECIEEPPMSDVKGEIMYID